MPVTIFERESAMSNVVVVVETKRDGIPDMRYKRNREKFLKNPEINRDNFADARLAENKGATLTKRELLRKKYPNATDEYIDRLAGIN
jgi:hypothetical protein